MKKKILIILAVLVAVILIAAIAGVIMLRSMLSEEKIRVYIDEAAKKYVGREVRYEKLSFNFIGVNLKKFEISENNTFENGIFLKSGNFIVKVELLPLLKKEIRVSKIGIDGLEVKVIKNKDGSFSFDDITKRFESTEEKKDVQTEINGETSVAALPDIFLGEVFVKKSVLSYTDFSEGSEAVLDNLNLEIDGFNFSKAFLCKVSFDLGYKDKEVNINLPLKAVMTADLKNMDMSQANFKMTSLDFKFEDMVLSGKMTVDGFTAPRITANIGITSLTDNTLKQFAKDMPQFNIPRADFSASVNLDLENGKADIKEFSANIFGSQINASGVAEWKKDLKYEIRTNLNLTLEILSQIVPEIAGDFNPKGKISGDLNIKTSKISADIKAENITAGFDPANAKNKDMISAGIPKFNVDKLNFSAILDADLDKNSANIKSMALDISGSNAGVSGTVEWGKDIKYDIKAKANLMLELINQILPGIVTEFDPKGKIAADAHITHKLIKAGVKTEKVSFKFEPMLTADNINAAVNIDSADNIKLSGLSGFINGKKFSGSADYLKTKSAMNININFDMEALIINGYPASAAVPAQETAGKTAASVSQETLPLNLNANIKTGAIKIPYFRCDKGGVINAKLTGITDKLDKVNGTASFDISSGNIEDAEKLARSNKITKMLFASLVVVDKVSKSLKIDALQGNTDKDGIAYDSFAGSFSFNDGKMNITKMDFISKLVTMKITGSTNFKNEKLDMKASVQPGVNKPVILKIGGTLSNPKGSIDLASSAVSIFGSDSDIGKIGAALGGKAPAEKKQGQTKDSEKKPTAEDVLKSVGDLFKKK